MRDDKVKVAVVTGGHAFDVQGLHRLFRRIPSADAYFQDIGNFAATADSIGLAKDNPFHPEKARSEYAVVLFFTMLKEEPTDEGLPLYMGQPGKALRALGDTAQGIFVMHHAVIQTRKWVMWNELVGMEDRTFKYFMDEPVRVQMANPNHPITKGMKPFEVVDETYKMADAGPENDILLTTDNPNSCRTLAWTRQYKNSRVFCTVLGHDDLVWSNPTFQMLVERAILWCARRI